MRSDVQRQRDGPMACIRESGGFLLPLGGLRLQQVHAIEKSLWRGAPLDG
ncbi:hypothetical protein ABZ499_08020 [Streptomyces sp. NPDC019990]